MSDRAIHRFAAASSARIDGFTLIELLLSITIFAIAIVAVNGVLFGAIRLRNSSQQAVERLLPIEFLGQAFRRDIAATAVPGDGIAAHFKTTIPQEWGGSELGLEFFTRSATVSDSQPFGDLQRVTYVLVDSTNRSSLRTGKSLVRAVVRDVLGNSTPVPDVQHLLEDVESLEFNFFDGTQWRPTWDSGSEASLIPQAVRMTATTFPQADEASRASDANNHAQTRELLEWTVLLMTVARTNAAGSASTGSTGGSSSSPTPQPPQPSNPGTPRGAGPNPGASNGGQPR